MMYPVDENGIPGTMGDDRFFDGGDSCAIAGTIEALGGSVGNALQWVLPEKFISKDTLTPIRHPDKTKWYGQPNRFSRDQLIPFICWCIPHRSIALELTFCAHAKRGFLTAWNTVGNGDNGKPQWPDITGPEVWALWIRYKRPWWGYPLLYVFDIQTFIGSLQWRWFPKNQLCRNHMLVSLAMKTWPTPWTWLVNKINDWPALASIWREHCYRAYEYDTSDWFEYAVYGGDKPVTEEQVYKTKETK